MASRHSRAVILEPKGGEKAGRPEPVRTRASNQRPPGRQLLRRFFWASAGVTEDIFRFSSGASQRNVAETKTTKVKKRLNVSYLHPSLGSQASMLTLTLLISVACAPDVGSNSDKMDTFSLAADKKGGKKCLFRSGWTPRTLVPVI